ncbi:MAG: hypothetical protein A2475_12940 [Ignavibacteria bacterium RIFOXYC2_FULL_35_21]|nr:MAG: hypothetical protein A2220_00230 [Ignavibacteria bacterium RIFOXYA2_FULL_35_10]OGV18882.1 MAG: hypothetical protein A2475_12940 [Ignavibacteria bacterium RIFOXYC2_FULL_35_21]
MNDYSTYRDKELLPLLREPKPASDYAFFEIYQRHSKKLNAYCMYRIFDPESIKDIIQDTWFEFVLSVRKGFIINNIQSYLLAIARNIIGKYQLHNQRKSTMFINKDGAFLDGLSFNMNLQQEIENNEKVSIVKLAVSSLDEPYREVFILKKINELTYQEIAGLTGDSVDSIRRIFSKALLMMNDLLKSYYEEIKN